MQSEAEFLLSLLNLSKRKEKKNEYNCRICRRQQKTSLPSNECPKHFRKPVNVIFKNFIEYNNNNNNELFSQNDTVFLTSVNEISIAVK